MARGAPRLWGVALGVPTVVVGLYVLVAGAAAVPPAVGYPFVLLGLLAIAGGLYVSRMAPAAPADEPLRTFNPNQLGAYLLGAASVLPLAVTLYLLFGTRVPYVWPTLAFAVFAYLFVRALTLYWQNSLTTYYIMKNGRIVSDYRFISLNRSSIQAESVQGVDRNQSRIETLVGLGNVTIRSASGDVSFRNLTKPGEAEQALKDATG